MRDKGSEKSVIGNMNNSMASMISVTFRMLAEYNSPLLHRKNLPPIV